MRQPQSRNQFKGQGPFQVKNNIRSVDEFKVTIVTTANGAKTNLLIFPGPAYKWLETKLSTTIPEQSDCKLNSSVSANNADGLIDFNKFIEQVGMYITSIQMTTTNTDVWLSSLYVGELPPNGIPNPEEIQLLPYAVSTGGGGYDKSLKILDHPLSNTRNFFMYLSSMPASTTLTFTFGIGLIGNTFSAEAPNS